MNTRHLRLLVFLLATLIALLVGGAALAQWSGAAINWQVISGGGAPSAGGNVTLNDTLGQPIIGPSSGGNVALGAGYWYGASFDKVQPFTYTKQVNATTATIGSNLIYTLFITNLDSIAPLTGGWVTDVLPLYTTYASGPSCNLATSGYDSGSHTMWWNGDIPTNTTLICAYTATVDRGLADGTLITNTAFFTVSAHGGWTNQVNTTVYAPVYSITKQSSGSLVIGAPLTYTLLVTNAGQGEGTSVVITDAVPANANHVSGGSLAGGVVSWTVSSIAAGNSDPVSFVVTACRTITNTWYRVVTSAQGIDSTWGAPLVTLLNSPFIVASFDRAPAQVTIGQPVYLTDTTTTDGGPLVAWLWNWGDNSVSSGEAISHTYGNAGVYTVTLAVTDTCGYTATVTLPTAITVTPSANLVIVKSDSPDPVTQGGNIAYTLVVSNNGPSVATNVVLTDSVPTDTTFQSLTAAAGWSCTMPPIGGTGDVVCTNPSLAAGTSATFTLVVQVSSGTPSRTVVDNTATVSSDTPDPTTPNAATASTTVGLHKMYLPVVMRNHAFAPDLVVTDVSVSSGYVQIVVKNQGGAAVPVNVDNEFWVDLYINPTTPPAAVNQTRETLGCQGGVWGVTVGALPQLVPGGVLTLTLNDAYYWPSKSDMPATLPAGAPIYAQVDSANTNTNYGAVLENHEIMGLPYNNIAQTVSSLLVGGQPPVAGQLRSLSPHLPPRP